MSGRKVLVARVEYALSGRAACQAKTACRGTVIPKNSLRWALKEQGLEWEVYYHWGCGNKDMINALSKAKSSSCTPLFERDQARVADAIRNGSIPANEIPESATLPTIDLPPPSESNELNHPVATLMTVGVGANHFVQRPNAGAIQLIRNPHNPADPNAIAIHVEHGCIGHLPAYCSLRLASLVDNAAVTLQAEAVDPHIDFSGRMRFPLQVGIFCAQEYRNKIVTALQRLRFEAHPRANLIIHLANETVSSE